MPTNKTLSRFAIAAAASLAASSALAGGVLPTPMSGVTVTDVSFGQIATASSSACAAAGAAPLLRNLRLGDLNGDGKDDILLTRTDGSTRSTARTWYYYPMNGTSKLTGDGTAALKADLDWLVMGLGDFDGDGKTDVLTRDSVAGTWHVALMNGKTVTTTGTGNADLTTNLDWRLAAIADFDGDGKDDVLLRHSGTNRWYQYAMNGKSHVVSKSGPVKDEALLDDGLPDDASWTVAGVGDLGGDGKGDVLLRHATNGTWHYYPMNGRAVASGSASVSLPSGSAWKLAGLADLDGDGKDGVLLRNTSGVWRWYQSPLVASPTHVATDLSTSATTWKLAGLGDLTGDGKDDVVLRDVSTVAANKGRWMVRAMNGASSIAAQSGVATSLTKVTAWDVAARDAPAPGSCAIASSCPAGTTAPGTPTISAMTTTSYNLVDVIDNVGGTETSAYETIITRRDSASVPVAWTKSAGAKGDKARYVVDGEVVLEAALTGTGTGAQNGSATVQIARSGSYDLEVAVCKGTCCTKSAKQTITVIDTDGAHKTAITLTPPSGHTQYTNKTGSMVAAYFVEWSGYQRDFDVHDIPAWNLTHILYGFIPICSATENDSLKSIGNSHAALLRACAGRADYKVAIHDPWAALGESRPGNVWNDLFKGNYGQIMQLKQAYPDLVILPSVGGWTLSDPFHSFSNATHRKTFVDSAEEFLKTWKFYDGVDIDWEYPGGYGANRALGDVVTDRQTYTDLMRELREMLDRMELHTGRRYHLTSAVGAGPEKIARVDYKTVQQYMDQILLMTYDFYGAWDVNVLGNMPGLFAPSWDLTDDYNTHSALQAMLSQGVDPAKVAIGASMYGRGWTGVNGWTGTNHMTGKGTGAYPSSKNFKKFSWEPGTQDYRGIAVDEKAARDSTNTTTTWTYHWDAESMAGYIYRPGTHDVMSYDNADSVRAKGAYVRSKGLAGLFSWEIDGDNGDILNAIHVGLGHGTAGANRAPQARAGVDQTVVTSAKGALDGSASFDEDGQPVTWSWSQTSGTTVTLSSTTNERPTFTAPTVTTNEDLVFTLTVSDGALTDTDTVTVTIRATNQTPVANAGADQTVQTTQSRTTVNLDGSASSDADGDTLTYTWTQTAGTTVTLENASQAAARFTTDQVTANTTLTFQLQVSDGNASHTDTVDITLTPAGANRAPVVTLAATKRVTEGDSVSISATATDADGDTLTYSWAVGTLTGVTGTSTRSISFTAPEVTADTDYTLTLTATDDDATPLSTSASIVVTVANRLATPSCSTTDPNASNYTDWDKDKSYTGGSRVAHNKLVWQAKYWTTEEPAVTATTWPEAWKLVSTGIEFAWNKARTYYANDEANHGTRRYRTAWETKGTDPTKGSPWSDVGANTCAGNQTPTANAGTDQSVTSGATVTLDGSGSSDPDTGDTLTYSWAHTSGTPSVTLTGPTTASPTFTAPAVTTSTAFVFTLTVSDGTATATDTVTITVAPAANQTPTANAGTDQSVTSGTTVTLDGSGSSDPDTGDTLTYSWAHTSGTPAVTLTGGTTASPTFTAPAVTTSTAFVFTLTVSDGTATATDTVTITVAPAANQAPTANAGTDQSVTSGTTVTLDGSGSLDPDTGDTLTYSWAHTSGTPAVTLTGGTTASPTFTAPAVTTSTAFVFTLTVSDGTATATDTVTITVAPAANQAPTANAGPDQTVAPGTTVTLDGSGSSDPDTGDTLTYSWAHTSGTPAVTLTGGTTASPTFTAPTSNTGPTFTLVFTLTVSDGTASATDTVTITVTLASNTAPTANAGPDQTVTSGTTVTLDGSGSSDPDGDTLTYSWAETVSGPSVTPSVTLTGPTTASPTFTAPAVNANADITFTLTVSDGNLSATDTVTITVTPATNTAPTANAGADQSVTAGASVTLDGSGSSDPDSGDTLTYSWAHTSGTPAVTLTGPTTASPTFTAPAVTTSTIFVFTLTVSDGNLSSTDTVTITVAPPANQAPTANAGADQSVTSGTTVTLDGSGSSDPDTGDTLTYSWAHTSGTPAVTLTGPTTASPTFTASAVSSSTAFVFTLTVSDGNLSATDTVTITVTPAAPNTAPTANAGADQTVTSGASATLDGTGSSDPDTGDTLTYSWAHTSGTPAVTLTGPTTASPTFTAPTVTATTDLVFTLTVSDGTASDTDTTTVTVACSRTDPNASNYTAWDENKSNYTGGNQVSHKGLVWQATQWTQHEPVITATDWPTQWALLSTTELKWHPERVYWGNDEADHGTRRYRAKWWTQGANPATDTTNVWTDIGAATCRVDHY